MQELRLLTIGRTVHGYPSLGTLAGTGLSSLTIRHPGLSGGLDPLPADLPLTELAVHNRADSRSLLGIERFPLLAKVTVTGVPQPKKIAALCALPGLRHLVLHDAHPVADLARLQPLADRLDVLEKAVGGELTAKLRTRAHS